jgi:predicted dehydrogenase
LRDATGSTLSAVSRARAELAAEFAREFGAEKHYADWRELVADPDLDAVYVATPVAPHAEQTIAAAEAGKHVLCEKPMALDVASCDRMIEACRANGVRLGVAYYRRFYPAVLRIKELIAAGAIGKPVLAQINAFERFNRGLDEPGGWRLDPAAGGGGPMMDFGSHRLEIFLNLFGKAEEVHGYADRLLFERAVEDTSGAWLRFESGVRAVLTVTHAAITPRDTLEIFGSEGSLHVGVLNEGDLRIVTPEGERQEAHPPHANLHQPLVEDFLAAIREGREPAVNGAVGREVQRLLEAVYGSS